MSRSGLKVLFVEDDPDDYLLVKDMLAELCDTRFDLVWAPTLEDASQYMENYCYDVCLLDYYLGERCGLDLLQETKGRRSGPPVILLTGQNEYDVDFTAMKAGASDYLTKDRIDGPRLERSIRYAIERKQTEAELQRHCSYLEALVERRTKELIQANEKLKEAERLLKKANRSLAIRIRERTAELEHSNEQLRQEIEERKRVEASLWENKEESKAFTERSATPTLLHDGERFFYANPSAEVFLGYSEEELFSMPFWNIVHPSMRGLVKDRAAARLRGEEIQSRYEVRYVNKKGETIWADTVATVIRHEGKPVILVNAIDITANIRSEEALLKSEQRYRTLFEEIPVSLMFEDYSEIGVCLDTLKDSGIKDLGSFLRSNPQFVRDCVASTKLIDLNRASLALFKAKSKKELIKHLPKIFCEETYESFRKLLIAIAEGKKSFEAETVIRMVTGERRDIWCRWSVAPGHERSLSRVLFSMLDMTERRQAERERLRAEAQLRHSQKLEALGTLAGGISHDFNNILGAILGFADIARLCLKDGEPVNDLLEEIWNAGLRARDLVKQILTFSRHGEQQKQSIQVGLLLKETLKLLRSALPSTIDIRHNFKITPGEDFIFANPTQIHQVIMNLCTNALQAMQDKGGVLSVGLSVTEFVRDEEASPAELAPCSYVELTVSDTGHGMDTAVLERIFEPYFTTKASGEGTGLGLAVVHGIVQDHDGEVIVESEPNVGTTFRVYVPRLKVQRETKLEKTEALSGGSEAILMVDDEDALLQAGKQMLERLGYSVITTRNGAQALDIFREQPQRFDLVITDYTMPLMTGVELAEELLRIRSDTPIVLCTGHGDAIKPDRLRACGILKLISKPLVLSEMAMIVRAVLDEGS